MACVAGVRRMRTAFNLCWRQVTLFLFRKKIVQTVKGGTQLGAHFRLSYTFVCSEPVEGPPYPQAGGKGPRVYLGASYTVVGVSRRVDG